MCVSTCAGVRISLVKCIVAPGNGAHVPVPWCVCVCLELFSRAAANANKTRRCESCIHGLRCLLGANIALLLRKGARMFIGVCMCLCTHSGGVPRRLNVVNSTSTRCPGPARKMYRHWREMFIGLCSSGALKVPFCGPPGLDTNVWSHSTAVKLDGVEKKSIGKFVREVV